MEKIRDFARPGESYAEARDRFLRDSATDLPACLGGAIKDFQELMDFALFRMTKKHARAGEMIRYEFADGHVEVTCGAHGMATIWDYDLILMLASHLAGAWNLYKKNAGPMPSTRVSLSMAEIIQFCRRGDGGRQSQQVEAALDRLVGTTIKVVRTGSKIRVASHEGLIRGYSALSSSRSGRIERLEIELPCWLYDTVARSGGRAFLTVHPDYYTIPSAVAKFIYRVARRAAGGSGAATYSFALLFQRSGMASEREFRRILRRVIRDDSLPGFSLCEVPGRAGPLLEMAIREG